MLQYKIIRTRYALSEYAQNTIEERLNEAVKDDWKVEQMASANVGTNVVETYLLSRQVLTDEERAMMEENFRTLKGINSPAELRTEEVEWIVLPDDANMGRWAEVYNQLRATATKATSGKERSQAVADNFKFVYGAEVPKYTLATMPDSWSSALTILREELPSEFVNMYHDWKDKYGDDWYAHNGWHFHGGMAIRNLLRDRGLNEKYFGVNNLDDIYTNLIELAIELYE